MLCFLITHYRLWAMLREHACMRLCGQPDFIRPVQRRSRRLAGVLIQHTPWERIVSAAPVQTKVSLAQWYASNREKYKCQLLLKIERPERAFCLISPDVNRAWSTLQNTVWFCFFAAPKDGLSKVLALPSPTWRDIFVESSGIISGAAQHM